MPFHLSGAPGQAYSEAGAWKHTQNAKALQFLVNSEKAVSSNVFISFK